MNHHSSGPVEGRDVPIVVPDAGQNYLPGLALGLSLGLWREEFLMTRRPLELAEPSDGVDAALARERGSSRPKAVAPSIERRAASSWNVLPGLLQHGVRPGGGLI